MQKKKFRMTKTKAAAIAAALAAILGPSVALKLQDFLEMVQSLLAR